MASAPNNRREFPCLPPGAESVLFCQIPLPCPQSHFHDIYPVQLLLGGHDVGSRKVHLKEVPQASRQIRKVRVQQEVDLCQQVACLLVMEGDIPEDPLGMQYCMSHNSL